MGNSNTKSQVNKYFPRKKPKDNINLFVLFASCDVNKYDNLCNHLLSCNDNNIIYVLNNSDKINYRKLINNIILDVNCDFHDKFETNLIINKFIVIGHGLSCNEIFNYKYMNTISLETDNKYMRKRDNISKYGDPKMIFINPIIDNITLHNYVNNNDESHNNMCIITTQDYKIKKNMDKLTSEIYFFPKITEKDLLNSILPKLDEINNKAGKINEVIKLILLYCQL